MSEYSESTPRVQLLHELTDRGFHLIPLHNPVFVSRDECVCSCGNPSCTDIGKHPRITGWQSDATTDPRKLARLLHKFPDCNWGVVCGRPSGLVVFDEDCPGEFEKLCANLGYEASPTFTVRTASGFHYYFSHDHHALPIGCRNLRPDYQIDIKGIGGQVVAPGSVHRSGLVYEAIEP